MLAVDAQRHGLRGDQIWRLVVERLALAAEVAALGVVAGAFAALTALMLALVLLPYADAWRQAGAAAEEKKHVG